MKETIKRLLDRLEDSDFTPGDRDYATAVMEGLFWAGYDLAASRAGESDSSLADELFRRGMEDLNRK